MAGMSITCLFDPSICGATPLSMHYLDGYSSDHVTAWLPVKKKRYRTVCMCMFTILSTTKYLG